MEALWFESDGHRNLRRTLALLKVCFVERTGCCV